VAAGIVRDQAVTAARQMTRALDDVSAGGAQPVEQHDRGARAGFLAGKSDAAVPGYLAQNLELVQIHGPTI
jgi:hypothetical protein